MSYDKTKKLGFFAIILLLLIGITACDSSTSSGSLYDTDIEVVLESGELVSQSSLENFSNEIRLRNVNSEAVLELNSNINENDDGTPILIGEINNLIGDRDSVTLLHEIYGMTTGTRISQNQNFARFYFDMSSSYDGDIGRDNGDNESDNGDSEYGNYVDVTVDRTSYSGTSIIKLDFDDYDQLGGTYFVHISIEHSGQNYTKERPMLAEGEEALRIDIDKNRDDESAVINILLLNHNKNVIAERKNLVINENTEEIDFEVLDDPYQFEISATSMNVSATSFSEYLAKYSIDARNSYQEEWVNLEIGSGSVQDLPSGFLTVNNIVIDMDYDFGNSDSFSRIFEHEHQVSGGQVENMELYYKLNEQTEIQNARDQQAVNNPEEVEANLTTVYMNNDGSLEGSPPYPRASAQISFDYEEYYQGEHHVYFVNVYDFDGGIAGLPSARRFTAGTPSSDPVNFGNEIQINAGKELNDLEVYILGFEMPDMNKNEEGFYEINSPDEFNQALRFAEARESSDDVKFLLTSDIDMEEVEDWTPIGTENWPFQGHLDGNNRKISNLSVDFNRRAGLFGEVGEDAIIEDIRIEGFDISGNSFVGALAGRNKGEIINVRLIDDNNISGEYSDIGGLIGSNVDGGVVIDSSVGSGTKVEGTGDETFRIGGLIGSNINGTIREDSMDKLFSSAEVSGISQIGGFVGYNNSNGIHDAMADGDVNGVEEVGGFVGRNEGKIENSRYVNSSVSGDGNYIGGFAGYNKLNGELISNEVVNVDVDGFNSVGGFAGINKYAINKVRVDNINVNGEDENIGGLVGDNTQDGDLRNSEFYGDVTGRDIVGGLAGRNTAGSDYSGDIPGGIFYNELHEDNQITGSENAEYVDMLIGHNTGVYSGNTGYGYLIVKGFEIDDEFLVGESHPTRITPDENIKILVKIKNDGDLNTTQDISVNISADEIDDIEKIEEEFNVSAGDTRSFDVTFNASDIQQDELNITIQVETNDVVGIGYFIITEKLNDISELADLKVDIDREINLDEYGEIYDYDELGNLDPSFDDKQDNSFEVIVSHLHDSIDITPYLQDDEWGRVDIGIEGEDLERTDNGEEFSVDLKDADETTEITVRSIAENGDETDYSINVIRESNPIEPKIDFDNSYIDQSYMYLGEEKDLEISLTLTGLVDLHDKENVGPHLIKVKHPFEDEIINIEFTHENIAPDGVAENISKIVSITPTEVDNYPVKIKEIVLESDGNVLDIGDERIVGTIEVREKDIFINGKVTLEDIDGLNKIEINLNGGEDSFDTRVFEGDDLQQDGTLEYKFGVESNGSNVLKIMLSLDDDSNLKIHYDDDSNYVFPDDGDESESIEIEIDESNNDIEGVDFIIRTKDEG